MSAVRAWAYSVVAVLGLVLALNHLGVDLTGTMVSVAHGTLHFLNQPI